MVSKVLHAICWTICLHIVSSATCLTCNVICHSDRSAALTGPNRGCLSMGWQSMSTLPLKYCQFHFYPTDSFLKIINDSLRLGLQHTEFGNYSSSFPEGRLVGVMTISLYSFSSHLFSSLFLSHILCHPPCLLYALSFFFFFFHLALSPIRKDQAPGLTLVPSTLTVGSEQELLRQGMEFWSTEQLLQVMPVVNSDH